MAGLEILKQLFDNNSSKPKGNEGIQVKRGEIYLLEQGSTKSSVSDKIRPYLVVQSNELNRTATQVIVAPFSTKVSSKNFKTDVKIKEGTGNLNRDTTVRTSQLAPIENFRSHIVRKVGQLDDATMKQIDLSLAFSLGLSIQREVTVNVQNLQEMVIQMGNKLTINISDQNGNPINDFQVLVDGQRQTIGLSVTLPVMPEFAELPSVESRDDKIWEEILTSGLY